MTARLKCKHRNLTIVQAYAPTEEAKLERKKAFYSHLEGVFLGIPKPDVAQMMGDFNTKVGSANDKFKHIVGKHGVGTMNENGNFSSNTIPHKECHKNT